MTTTEGAQGGRRPGPRRGRPKAVPARVFLAEGDVHLRTLAAAVLRADGREVVEVADGPRLVQALVHSLTGFAPRAPDLIVMRAGLPGWTGLNILQRLRRFDPLTPVVILCTDEDRSLAEQALELGISALLEYPFDQAELRRVAQEALGQ